MKFFLFDENTAREYSFEVTDLERDHWDVWCDQDGLKALLDGIDSRFGGLFEDCSSRTTIGYKSFYFSVKEYPLILRMFKKYFETCGYTVE